MNNKKQYNSFEICSIRPPTENCSLTFRLTRNCYWNKCMFCPVYKSGAVFSRRSIGEVMQDINAAWLLNDRLDNLNAVSAAGEYENAHELIEQIYHAQGAETNLRNREKSAGKALNAENDPLTDWFMQWFKDKPTIADSINQLVAWRLDGGRTCFLGDADSLILKPFFLKKIIDGVKQKFPSVHRFTVYGRTRTAARYRTAAELKDFRNAGLNRVHFGIESGSDTVLEQVCKGETKDDHISGCLKTKEAGLAVSVYVMPGLGGQKYSGEHAEETADVINQAAPDFVRLRTLQVFPGTPLAKQRTDGFFHEAAEEQVVAEIRQMIMNINAPTQIISDSATNLLQVNGRLPGDRRAMLSVIDGYLSLSPADKKLFSLQARMESFEGQYGGFSEDIYQKLMPYIQNNALDIASIPEPALDDLIFLIRSKLMP